MSHIPRSRRTLTVATGLAATVVTGALLIAVPAGSASAAVSTAAVTATFSRNGIGLSNVIADANGTLRPAGYNFLKLSDGTELKAYSADFDDFDVDTTGTYEAEPWPAGGASSSNLAKITDIAIRHDSIGTKFAKSNWEAAAAQTAIWSLTNNVSYKKIANPQFVARVDALLAAASSRPPAPEFRYSLSAARTGQDDGSVISVTLSTPNGPAAGKALVFTVDGQEQTLTTNAQGTASLEVPNTVSNRIVAVDFSTDVPAGTVFAPESGGQLMIAAQGYDVSKHLSIDAATGAPILTATPPPVATPIPTTTPTPAEWSALPITPVDHVPPTIKSATLRGHELIVKATDTHGSGLAHIQAAHRKHGKAVTRRFSGSTRRYGTHTSEVHVPARTRFVRVADKAGNWSKWRAVKVKSA